MQRRDLLRAGGLAGLGSLAGCLGLLETRSLSAEPALVENRPAAVYLPTHVEGMQMAGMETEGDYRVGLMFSYPHRFWTVQRDGDGLDTSMVAVTDEDDVHLMVRVLDAETGQVLPDIGVSVEILRDGSLVSQETIYQMLSMRMGYHHGANFGLDGNGTYTVNVSIGGMNLRRLGAFAGRFDRSTTVSVPFEYRRSDRDAIPYRTLDGAGRPGATEAMTMAAMPNATVPTVEALPGRVLGEATSGDARFAASVVERGEGPYLAVWAATPYNRMLVPNMRLSVTGAGADGSLTPTLDPALGYHHGVAVDDPGPDSLTLSVDTPPFVARHEGYETAFLEMPPVELPAAASS
jgi:hypothetical protein